MGIILIKDLPPIANVIIALANKIIEVINDANVKGVNCVSDNINDKKNQEIAPRNCKIAEEI